MKLCVVNNKFKLLYFFFHFISIDPQNNEISLTVTAWSVRLCGVCSDVVCLDVVFVPCEVGVAVTVTVMRVLLYVWVVSMLSEFEGDGNGGVGPGEVWFR